MGQKSQPKPTYLRLAGRVDFCQAYCIVLRVTVVDLLVVVITNFFCLDIDFFKYINLNNNFCSVSSQLSSSFGSQFLFNGLDASGTNIFILCQNNFKNGACVKLYMVPTILLTFLVRTFLKNRGNIKLA